MDETIKYDLIRKRRIGQFYLKVGETEKFGEDHDVQEFKILLAKIMDYELTEIRLRCCDDSRIRNESGQVFIAPARTALCFDPETVIYQ